MTSHASYLDTVKERLDRNNQDGFSDNQRGLICIALANMYFPQLRDFIKTHRPDKIKQYGSRDSDLKDYALFELEQDDEMLGLALEAFARDEASNITSDVELVSEHIARRAMEENIDALLRGPNTDRIAEVMEKKIPGISDAFNDEMETAMDTFPDLKDKITVELIARLAIYHDTMDEQLRGPIGREGGMH